MNRIVIILIYFSLTTAIFAQNKYSQAWTALDKNDHKTAQVLLKEGISDRTTFVDSYITNIYFQTYNGKEETITDFGKTFYESAENPYPYIYALWFNESILGKYGQKKPFQLSIIDKLIKDTKAPGNLISAAYYQKGMNFLCFNDFKNSAVEFSKVGNIKNWQYVGPFENLSGSGFSKNYGPLDHPEGTAEFIIKGNTKVNWFVPTVEIQDGWTPLSFSFNTRSGIVYAQNFIESPIDQEVYCNFGVSGSIKAWLNDELIVSEPKERVTEMDTYCQKCKLQKGSNRFLVQVGFTDANYPNFNLRITDSTHRAIKNLKGSSIYKSYTKGINTTTQKINHFAEVFFEDKILKEPDNMVNYLLLTDVYLRNEKILEARTLMEKALLKHPNNNILRFQLINVLNKEVNRSMLLEECAKLKESDPNSLLSLELDINEDITNERYEDVKKKIAFRESLFGEDLTTIEYKINILAKENNYDELLKLVERAYKKYPDSPLLLPIMYAIKNSVYKDPNGALKVYEDYLKRNYDYSVLQKYIELLSERGETKKVVDQKMKLIQHFPYDPYFFYEMSNYYFQTKDYKNAENYIQEALGRSPYHKLYLEQLGDIKREQKKNSEAILAYEKSLLFDANQYELINKIRKLNGKTESYNIVPTVNIDSLIKSDNPKKALNTDVGYYVLLDDQNVVIHPGGATEGYYTYVLRITNEKGIEKYKESSIGYGRRQTLLIEQVEVVKKSGSRIRGEQNENEIVFANLEVGDVLVFKYRIQNYNYSRFARDFAEKFYFKRSAYFANARYKLFVPPNLKINFKTTNFTQSPSIKSVEDFKLYSWEVKNQEAVKEEPVMPAYVDIVPVLHVSTIESWQDVANWYADLINKASEESYEITSLFNSLLPANDRKKLSQFEQAKRIYNYIQKNIRYSSVSFRQSAYLPQRASKTLNTRLGDCKDLSNLFMTLCRMAGIKCNMVLVNTYDNGGQYLVLPSTDFNHCIAKAILDNKVYYIELTDNYLPFGSLPNNLINAQILDIPRDSEPTTLKTLTLTATTKTKDIVKRTIYLKPQGSDLQVKTKCVKYGHHSSSTRSNYSNLNYEKQLKKIEEFVSSSYENSLVMDTFKIKGLENLNDSIQYEYAFKVKDEILEIGDVKTFKIVYPDLITSPSKFPSLTRNYPVNYNEYEDTDIYQTNIIIDIPKGNKITSFPPDENIKFKKMNYLLQYKLVSDNKLIITRKFNSDRNPVAVNDYPEFKSFMEKIVKAEQKRVAFK